jgi:hypothetical protein
MIGPSRAARRSVPTAGCAPAWADPKFLAQVTNPKAFVSARKLSNSPESIRGCPEPASLKKLSGFVSLWVSFDPRYGDFGFVPAYSSTSRRTSTSTIFGCGYAALGAMQARYPLPAVWVHQCELIAATDHDPRLGVSTFKQYTCYFVGTHDEAFPATPVW